MKEYIGDGVYVTIEGTTGAIILTAEDGVRITNTIYLEPDIWVALVRLVRRSRPDLPVH